jgi:acetate kinase
MKILTINAGSSSLKACFFNNDATIAPTRKDFSYANVAVQERAIERLLIDLDGEKPDIVGHRIVHGGDITEAARILNDEEYIRLVSLIPLAPLHLPSNLLGYMACSKFCNVPQVACYDTAFHSTIPEINYRLAIPENFKLRKYGFHGLSYSYVASILPSMIGNLAYGKVIVAHLGSGSSLCLMDNLKSVDTTMGYTPMGGVVMGTRSGDLDPGVVLELFTKVKDPRYILAHKSGLLALSNGISSDMQELCSLPESKDAIFAIDSFCSSVRGAIGSLAAKAGGVDVLVFTGGIGENSTEIRRKIAGSLGFLGIKLIIVVKTDEERTIYNLCKRYL